jgi:single-stranded DNA-binding protein
MSSTNFGYLQGTPINYEERQVTGHVISTINLGFGGGKNKDGTFKDPQYAKVEVWDLDPMMKELVEKNLKSCLIGLSYQLKYNSWQDKNGNNRNQLLLSAFNLSFVKKFNKKPEPKPEPEPVVDDSSIPF